MHWIVACILREVQKWKFIALIPIWVVTPQTFVDHIRAKSLLHIESQLQYTIRAKSETYSIVVIKIALHETACSDSCKHVFDLEIEVWILLKLSFYAY